MQRILAVAVASVLMVLGMAAPASAATVVISDQASCEAAGGTWQINEFGVCVTPSISVGPGDTTLLQVPADISFGAVSGVLVADPGADQDRRVFYSTLPASEFVSASGTVKVESGLMFVPRMDSAGVVEVKGGQLRIGVAGFNNALSNSGQMLVANGAELLVAARATLTNSGDIWVGCTGTITLETFGEAVTGQITGNEPVTDCAAPEATVTLTPATPVADDWYDGPVDYDISWSDDNGAGLGEGCAPSQGTLTESDELPLGPCADRVGNTTAATTVPVKIDTTDPVADPKVKGSTVTWNWSDTESDTNDCDTTTVAEGAGTVTVESVCVDAVGNEATATQEVTIADPVATPSPVVAGGKVTINAAGFRPSEDVDVDLFSDPVDVGDFTADSGGQVEGEVTIPASTPAGPHTLVLTGADSEQTVEIPITVSAATTPTPEPTPDPTPPADDGATSGDLANTGGGRAIELAKGALVLLVVGAGLFLAGRRLHA